MSTFPTKFIHPNHFAGHSDFAKDGRSQRHRSSEDQLGGTSASGGSSIFDYTFTEQLSDRHAVAAFIRQNWLQCKSGLRPPHASVSINARKLASMSTRLNNSVAGLLTGGLLVAGVTYISSFDGSPPDVNQTSALMTTLGEMWLDTIPPRSPQSSPPWIKSHGIDRSDGIRPTRESEHDFQASPLQAFTSSDNRPNESGVTGFQLTLDSESRTSNSKTIAAERS